MKKSSVYYWKGGFVGVSGLKTQLSVINWFFFPQIHILIFLREKTQNDHNRLLYKFENDQKNFGFDRSCGYAPASVKLFPSISYRSSKNPSIFVWLTCRPIKSQDFKSRTGENSLCNSVALYKMYAYIWRAADIFRVV